MQEIKVTSCFKPRRYRSAIEAFASLRENTEYQRSRTESTQLRGKIVQDVKYYDQEVIIVFTDGSALLLYIEGTEVTWKILSPGDPLVTNYDHKNSMENDYQLHWQNSGHTSYWQRRETIHAWIGKRITELQKPEGPLLLRGEKQFEISFSAIDLVSTQARVLFWQIT